MSDNKSDDKSKHVVIVDDEEDITYIMAATLEMNGYRVKAFTNPSHAIDYFKKNGKNVDHLLVDVNMPDISGFELINYIIPYNGSTKKYLMSGYVEPKHMNLIESLKSQGVVAGFLQKPFNPAEILSILNGTYKVRQEHHPF